MFFTRMGNAMNGCDTGACESDEGRGLGPGRRARCRCGPDCLCGYGGGDRMDDFMALAFDAHHELLKQKIKSVFEAKIGKKMDKVADVVAEAALVYMQDRMREETTRDEFEAKLEAIFKG